MCADHVSEEARLVTELVARTRPGGLARPRVGGLLVFERNVLVYRRTWLILLSGFFEPLFYLVFFVIPLSSIVGDVELNGEEVAYAAFVAPALLAASAMNGAFYDATNVFWKLRYGKVYDAMLSTPVSPRDVATGETLWAVSRALLYSVAFLLVITVLGYVESPWAILVLPACFVIGFGFAGAGIAAVTWMRTWKDFDLVTLVMLPMFMFSATFYPIDVYPDVVEWIVRILPLYHGIELVRALTTGTVGPMQLLDVAYLATMGVVGMLVASRRIDKLLLK
jgi:lipooligosaccharide transport system permease protein